MKDNKTQSQQTEAQDQLLKQYYAQVEDNDDVHTYHVDGYTYGDYTDSCC